MGVWVVWMAWDGRRPHWPRSFHPRTRLVRRTPGTVDSDRSDQRTRSEGGRAAAGRGGRGGSRRRVGRSGQERAARDERWARAGWAVREPRPGQDARNKYFSPPANRRPRQRHRSLGPSILIPIADRRCPTRRPPALARPISAREGSRPACSGRPYVICLQRPPHGPASELENIHPAHGPTRTTESPQEKTRTVLRRDAMAGDVGHAGGRVGPRKASLRRLNAASLCFRERLCHAALPRPPSLPSSALPRASFFFPPRTQTPSLSSPPSLPSHVSRSSTACVDPLVFRYVRIPPVPAYSKRHPHRGRDSDNRPRPPMRPSSNAYFWSSPSAHLQQRGFAQSCHPHTSAVRARPATAPSCHPWASPTLFPPCRPSAARAAALHPGTPILNSVANTRPSRTPNTPLASH